MVVVGRDLWRSSNATPLLKQVHLEPTSTSNPNDSSYWLVTWSSLFSQVLFSLTMTSTSRTGRIPHVKQAQTSYHSAVIAQHWLKVPFIRGRIAGFLFKLTQRKKNNICPDLLAFSFLQQLLVWDNFKRLAFMKWIGNHSSVPHTQQTGNRIKPFTSKAVVQIQNNP